MKILVVPPNNILRHPIVNRLYKVLEHLSRRHDIMVLDYPCHPHAKLKEPRPLRAWVISYKPLYCGGNLGLYYMVNSPVYLRVAKEVIRYVDIIVNANIVPSIAFLEKALEKGVPTVYDFMEYYPEASSAYYSTGRSVIESIVWRKVAKLVKGSKRVIAVSYSFAAILRKLYSVEPIVIPNGSEEYFKPLEREEALFKEIDGEPVLLYYGSIDEWIDYTGLIRFFEKTLKHYPRARLYIYGYPHNRAVLYRLLRTVSKRGLLGKVIVRSPVPHRVLPRIIGASDIVVAPYKRIVHNYTFPVKIVEALSCGKPVVAPGIGEYRLWFHDLIVYYDGGIADNDPAQIIGEALSKTDLVKRNSSSIRERFSWRRISMEYERVLEATTSSI